MARSAPLREKRFRYGEKEREELALTRSTSARSGRLVSVPAGAVLLAHDGTRRRHLGAQRRVPAQRATDPCELRPAERSRRTQRSGGAGANLLLVARPARPVLLPRAEGMVHGEVRPPLLDLANRDLVESHLSAVWLACTEEPLDPSIAELLVLAHPRARSSDGAGTHESSTGGTTRGQVAHPAVLDLLEDDLTQARLAPWYPGRDAVRERSGQTGRSADLTRRFDAGAICFCRRTAAGCGAADRWTTTRPRIKKSAPQESLPASDGAARVAPEGRPAASPVTSTPTDTWPPRDFCPATTSPACHCGRSSRRQRWSRQTDLPPATAVPCRCPSSVRAAWSITRVAPTAWCVRCCRSATRMPPRRQTLAHPVGPHLQVLRRWSLSTTRSRCATPAGSHSVRPRSSNIYRIENVATQPAERITANDEERQRQGFELQTTFEWAVRDQRRRRAPRRSPRMPKARSSVSPMVRAPPSPASTRVSAVAPTGPSSDSTSIRSRATGLRTRTRATSRTDPRPRHSNGSFPACRIAKMRCCSSPACRSSLKYPRDGAACTPARNRGRVSAGRGRDPRRADAQARHPQRIPTLRGDRGWSRRAHAADRRARAPCRGGQGRAADHAPGCQRFAVHSQRISRSFVDAPMTTCVAACYRCLMSYYNQPDHELLDRRDEQARNFLLRLAHAKTRAGGRARTHRHPKRRTQHQLKTPARIACCKRRGPAHCRLRMPSRFSEGAVTLPLIWRSHYVAATIDPLPAALNRKLENKGFEVISFGTTETAWPDAFRRLAAALGRAS
jgi:hypothetical protein